MSLETKHPRYIERLLDWTLLRDATKGERAIKDKRTTYLPATSGQTQDGLGNNQEGKAQYDDYICRARFPEFNKTAIQGMIGIMHREPATIQVPAKLEGMLERATANGEPMQTLLRKINEQQLEVGRLGLLVEVPSGLGPEAIPFIATYNAESVQNWDDGRKEQGEQVLELVVLNESEHERTSQFEWEWITKYRVLSLSGVVEGIPNTDQGPVADGQYVVAAVRERNDVGPGDFILPSIAGNTLEKIPFVFINPSDLVSTPDDPPLLPLANLSLVVYRGEADYRHTLHMQGQETFVISGATPQSLDGDKRRFGAGAFLELPMGGKAEFVGVSADGLDAQQKALENDKAEAAQLGAHLMDNIGAGVESGEALRIRVAAKTANLIDIARTGAEGLKQALRMAAEWVGANPEEVVVDPNLDFADDPMTGKMLAEFMGAKVMGAPISLQSIHKLMQDRELTEMEFEEEVEVIQQEVDLLPTGREEEDDDDEVDT
jgi:hypothetical protein